MKLVELREYTVRTEAELALNMLQQRGIRAILRSDDLAGLTPSLGLVNGYQIMVDQDSLEEAKALLG